MAEVEGRITKNPPAGGPDDLEFDEVLEQMLPLCDDDPFEVARWLNAGRQKKEGIRLLADGVPVLPHIWTIVAKIAGDGRPTLEVVSPLDDVMARIGDTIDTMGNRLITPARKAHRWTVERKSFEANRPDAPRNRGGRPDKYPHMHIVTEALIYIAVNGTPTTLDGEGGLFEKLELVLKPRDTPKRGMLYKIFNPIWKRVEDERKRIENERKKKPRQ